MQEKVKSEGKCLFCGKIFAKPGINKHLSTHLKEIAKSGKSGLSFLVKVETKKQWGSTPYFLSLWVDGEATMEVIDVFLRGIWLECCGHMSAFRNRKNQTTMGWDYLEAMELMAKGKTKEYEQLMEDGSGEVPMSRKAKDALSKGLALEYEYDFGSSTELTITVMDEYPVKADKEIVLLSRNEPLHFLCTICGKAPATKICQFCIYNGPAWFCNKCAKKHAKECDDFDEDNSLPVVNSPRVGICAYEGGTIDTERDTN